MQPRREVLDSGLRVILAPSRDTRTVTVLVFVEAGSKYETKKINGISHFLEHLCFKGTEKYPTPTSISYAFDELGAENNAFTAEEYTGYYVKSDAKHFDKVLELISELYLNATLPEDEIERERGVVVEEINLYNDQPTYHAEDLITDLLYDTQPAGLEVLGTKENIIRLSRSTIEKYRKEHYVASGTTVIVAGNVRVGEALRKVRNVFKDISREKKGKKESVVENQKKPVVGVRNRKTDQTHLILGIRTVPFSHKDSATLSVLATILGSGMSSRLFTRMRDELGLCYYISANNRFYSDHGYLAVRAGVSTARTKEAVEEILNVCKTLDTDIVEKRELRKAKNYAIGNMYLSLEATDALAYSYGIQETLGKKILSPSGRARKIREVDGSDIQRVAKKIFQDKNLNLAVVGPYKNGKQFSSVLHI